jgi:hypothetical protein
MDQSIQNHLAVEPVQSIAETKSKKTRRLVGLPKDDHRSYNAGDLPLCNWNGLAVSIIQHVRFNTKLHKRPTAFSLAYWSAFFKGCPEQRVRTAVQDAMDSKLIKRSYGWFNGSNTPHYMYVGPDVEINTPHVEINKTITEGNQQKVTTNLNTQNGISGSAEPTAHTPEGFSKAPGKVTPKTKPQASTAFVDVFLSRKQEWLKTCTNSDNPGGCVLPELTDTDRDICQRVEYRLAEAGIDPLAFMGWLTCKCFQQFALGLGDGADYSSRWLGKLAHLAALVDLYRATQATLEPLSEPVACAPMSEPAQPVTEHVWPAGYDPEQCSYQEWLDALKASTKYEGVTL